MRAGQGRGQVLRKRIWENAKRHTAKLTLSQKTSNMGKQKRNKISGLRSQGGFRFNGQRRFEVFYQHGGERREKGAASRGHETERRKQQQGRKERIVPVEEESGKGKDAPLIVGVHVQQGLLSRKKLDCTVLQKKEKGVGCCHCSLEPYW